MELNKELLGNVEGMTKQELMGSMRRVKLLEADNNIALMKRYKYNMYLVEMQRDIHEEMVVRKRFVFYLVFRQLVR